MELSNQVREYLSKAGKKGGRPRTVPHTEFGFCYCAECRNIRQTKYKSETKSKAGAITERLERLRKLKRPKPASDGGTLQAENMVKVPASALPDAVVSQPPKSPSSGTTGFVSFPEAASRLGITVDQLNDRVGMDFTVKITRDASGNRLLTDTWVNEQKKP